MLKIFLWPFKYYAWEKNNGDYVIVLHGIVKSSHHMKSLARYIKRGGFEVININYPSNKYKIEELVEIINQEISSRAIEDKKIHFVGYSMGALLIRALIHKYRYKNLGRVVQLATPNHGSEIEDLTKNLWLYKKIFGPAGQQLVTDQKIFEHLFGQVNYELGIIAGNATLDPIFSIIIPGPDDGRVGVEKTKLEGMKDHIIIKVSHSFFPYSTKVRKQTLHFLTHGNFLHQLIK
jgi:hypothetical protein